MKKFLAAVLAAAMVVGTGISAFAAVTTEGSDPIAESVTVGAWYDKDGDEIKSFTVDKDDYAVVDGVAITGVDKCVLDVDQTIRAELTPDQLDGKDTTIDGIKLRATNVPSGVKVALVKDDGKYYIEMKIADTYSTKLANFDGMKLTLKNGSKTVDVSSADANVFKVDADDDVITGDYFNKDLGIKSAVYFGNRAEKAPAAEEVTVTKEGAKDCPVVGFVKANRKVTIETGNATFKAPLIDQGKKYLDFVTDVNALTEKEVKALAVFNDKADIEAIKFLARPAMDFSGAMEIYPAEVKADTTYYLYEINKDGKLVKANAKWDKEGFFSLKTKELGTYIISDEELKDVPANSEVSSTPATSDNGNKENPGTGANDMVGVAVALAVVSVAAAGAVALKK